MRTSRPLKHAPKPLLSTSSKSSKKDKKSTKPRQPQSAVEATGDDVYSFASGSKRAKGARHAEARLKTARGTVGEASSNARNNGGRSRKGKARQLDGNDDNHLDGGDDADDFGGGMPDLSKVKFRLGIGSDDDLGAADDGDDDEEIDSDLADTDHEGTDDETLAASKKRKSKTSTEPAAASQRKRKRDVSASIYALLRLSDSHSQVASDFYQDTNQVEIDLDERTEGTSRQASSRGKRRAQQSESESGSEDEDLDEGSDGEFVLLSDMWDRPSNAVEIPQEQEEDALLSFKPKLSMPIANSSKTTVSTGSEANESAEEDEETSGDEDNSEDDDESMLSDDEVDEDAAGRLTALIGGLPTTKPDTNGVTSDTQVADANVPRKKRRLFDMQEQTERMPESEFAVTRSDQTKLTLDMMLGGLPADQAALLKKSLKPLAATTKTLQPKGKDADIAAEVARLSASEAALLARERQQKQDNKLKSILRMPGALPVPLAPLHQAKIERQAAKERMGVEVKKWDETVKSSAFNVTSRKRDEADGTSQCEVSAKMGMTRLKSASSCLCSLKAVISDLLQLSSSQNSGYVEEYR